MKVVALLLMMALAVVARSQNTINNYKYVLVPERFDIFKREDQYGINTLTKTLLDSVGFKSFMANEPLPNDLASNKCNALKADLIEKKKFLATALILVLKDCQGDIIYKGGEGVSREKDWDLVYTDALRRAFVSLQAAHYKYDSTRTPPVIQTTATTAPAPVLPAATPATVADNKEVLYAQANANGYQLIDTSPKKVMTLLKTSIPNHFIADNGVEKGIVFSKNDEWYFEYYKDDKLVSQKLSIKF